VKDVSVDRQAIAELVHKYHSRSTPTIIVDDQIMIGFNPEQLDKMLGS
jgi:arsenate reductase-like glutaredoxin family protein